MLRIIGFTIMIFVVIILRIVVMRVMIIYIMINGIQYCHQYVRMLVVIDSIKTC